VLVREGDREIVNSNVMLLEEIKFARRSSPRFPLVSCNSLVLKELRCWQRLASPLLLSCCRFSLADWELASGESVD